MAAGNDDGGTACAESLRSSQELELGARSPVPSCRGTALFASAFRNPVRRKVTVRNRRNPVHTSSEAPAATAGPAGAGGGGGSSPGGAPGMFAALSVRNFRRYISGQALSLIGTWVETVAQALLVLRLTHSGVVLGLTTAARYAPVLLLSPYAGLLVDRFPKRRVLLITQAGLGLVSLALGILVLSGIVDLGQIVVLALAFGTFSAVDNPARQA